MFSVIEFCAMGQRNQVGLRISYARMDAFNGIQFSRTLARFNHDLSFEWGVNRTYLQRRFFPRLTLSSSLPLLDKQTLKLAPLASCGYALLKTNLQTNRLHQWYEIYGGFKMEVGKKWKGIIVVSGGWLMEQYFNAYLNRQSFAHTLGFNGSVALVFCW